MRGMFYTHEILTSLALIGLSWLTDTLTPENGEPLAKTNYLLFLIYSGICFSKIARLFKTILNELPQIKAVLGLLGNLKPFLRDLLGMAVCIFLIFGQIGINNYGGMISSKTPSLYLTKTGMELSKDYHKVNFNDFPNSIVSLYGVFLKSNWLEIANMYLISSTNNNMRFYFVSFQLLLNLLILNVIIGFIVEVILAHLNKKYGRYIKIDQAILNAKSSEESDDSSKEEEMDEDIFVDDEKDTDIEAQAARIAEKLRQGMEKNLKVVTGEKKKLDRKTEVQGEMTPIL
jgi:hypothetical protein